MDQEPRSQASGVAVLTVATLGAGVAVYAVSHDWFVLAVWAIGWALIVKVARTRNPSPPPPSGPSPAENTQVEWVQDPANPHHWTTETGTS